jgi:predicted dehydrogenase
MAHIFKDADRAGHIVFCAVADINRKVVDNLTAKHGINGYADYKEMIGREKLDAVAIATPDHLHEEIAVYSAEKGLHMLVQKPLDTSSAGARRIVNAARDSNVLLYVDFHKRFDPGIVLARKQYTDGVFGELLYGYLNIEDTLYIPVEAFKHWAHLSSPAWFIGIHLVDALNWMLDMAPVKVSAAGLKKKLAGMGIDTYDVLSARLTYKNGAVITLDASWVLPLDFPSAVNQNIRLVGTDGFIEIDGQDRGVQYWTGKTKNTSDQLNNMINNPYGYLESPNCITDYSLSGYTVDSVIYFIKLLQKIDAGATVDSLSGTYPNGVESALATRIVETIHQSAETGATVDV